MFDHLDHLSTVCQVCHDNAIDLRTVEFVCQEHMSIVLLAYSTPRES